MKTVFLKKSITLLALASLVYPVCKAETAPEAPKAHLVLDYQTPADFLHDFSNTSIKADKTLMYWTTQLVLLMQKDQNLKPFCAELITAARTRNANRIKLLFINYQDKFSGELQDMIKSLGLKKIGDAINKRAEK